VLGFLILAVAVLLIAISLGLARRWSRYLERERLRAFRETARRVAHEMRGPITASRLALRRIETNGQDELLAVLDEETERLERMSHEFSEFGRLPEGPEAEIDMAELIESVVTATVPAGVAVSTDVGEHVSIRGHYEPLRRAMQNLIRNAVDVVGPQGIEVRVTRTDGTVRVTVADDGPGIPADSRQRIFEPYFTTKKHGTGLGLAMVKQTVLAHGGTIDAEKSPSGGAKFVINLPERT
jgi:signal transduction histidine kinase